jgi:hypothetical protein
MGKNVQIDGGHGGVPSPGVAKRLCSARAGESANRIEHLRDRSRKPDEADRVLPMAIGV